MLLAFTCCIYLTHSLKKILCLQSDFILVEVGLNHAHMTIAFPGNQDSLLYLILCKIPLTLIQPKCF